MAQPQMARIICSHCRAWYSSERELRDHKAMAHRQFSSLSESSPLSAKPYIVPLDETLEPKPRPVAVEE